jgi:hypothetical protein
MLPITPTRLFIVFTKLHFNFYKINFFVSKKIHYFAIMKIYKNITVKMAAELTGYSCSTIKSICNGNRTNTIGIFNAKKIAGAWFLSIKK